jgi:hypothetical protein
MVWSSSDLLTGVYILCISIYITVTIPALRTIVTPLEMDTHEDRIEAMRVLSAGNVMIMVGLGSILVLQVGGNSLRKHFPRPHVNRRDKNMRGARSSRPWPGLKRRRKRRLPRPRKKTNENFLPKVTTY